jgi:hypothetical protein
MLKYAYLDDLKVKLEFKDALTACDLFLSAELGTEAWRGHPRCRRTDFPI